MLYVSRESGPTEERYPQGIQFQSATVYNPEKEHMQTQKPNAPLIGADGNIFNLIGNASCTLHDAGMQEKADQMFQRIATSGSYEEALDIISEYVNFTET